MACGMKCGISGGIHIYIYIHIQTKEKRKDLSLSGKVNVIKEFERFV